MRGWWILPFAVLGAAFWTTVLTAGTWEDVERFDADCAYIPPKTACLSACCFAWMKAPNKTNDGICGLHMPYRFSTGEPDAFIRLKVVNHLISYGWREYYDTIKVHTDKRTFLMFADGRDPWLQSWKELDGYMITSDPIPDIDCQ